MRNSAIWGHLGTRSCVFVMPKSQDTARRAGGGPGKCLRGPPPGQRDGRHGAARRDGRLIAPERRRQQLCRAGKALESFNRKRIRPCAPGRPQPRGMIKVVISLAAIGGQARKMTAIMVLILRCAAGTAVSWTNRTPKIPCRGGPRSRRDVGERLIGPTRSRAACPLRPASLHEANSRQLQ
jgi:hypothetical protein